MEIWRQSRSHKVLKEQNSTYKVERVLTNRSDEHM